jgi:hypothetical protein
MTEAELRKQLLWGWWWCGTRSASEEIPPMPPDDQLPQEFLDWREMARRAREETSP